MVTAAYGYPGPYTTYTPNTEASQSLLVGYSRNPKSFEIADYTQYVQVKQMLGLYRLWKSEQAARILTNDDAEHIWPDGSASGDGQRNTEAMLDQAYRCIRRKFDFAIGDMAIEQADFPIIAAHAAEQAQLAMTSRTLRTYNVLNNTAWGANTAAVNGGILLGGQDWTTGSTGVSPNQGPNIKTSLQFGIQQINVATFGVVDNAPLNLVTNPNLAQAMARSTEIQDYLKQSPFALAQIKGDSPNQNGQWGMPPELYGVSYKIEKTVRVSSRQNATTLVSGYVFPNTVAFLLARDGSLEGIAGARNFSTVQVFIFKDEMTVETFNDTKNRRTEGRVVINDAPVVVSTPSGFYFTACKSS